MATNAVIFTPTANRTPVPYSTCFDTSARLSPRVALEQAAKWATRKHSCAFAGVVADDNMFMVEILLCICCEGLLRTSKAFVLTRMDENGEVTANKPRRLTFAASAEVIEVPIDDEERMTKKHKIREINNDIGRNTLEAMREKRDDAIDMFVYDVPIDRSVAWCVIRSTLKHYERQVGMQAHTAPLEVRAHC